MRVLISGGGGYIGSMLVPAMLEAGHHVTVLDTFVHSENSLAASCAHKKFDVVRGDCRNPATLKPMLDRADVIIPLAAIVGMPACAADPTLAWSTNFEAVRLICDFASPDQRIILPNSNSGYGTTPPGTVCTEETIMKPVSVYGQSKQRAEEVVMCRQESVGFRLATVFGMSPRLRIDLMLNDFVYRAVTDRAITLFEPDVMRNFIHIRNIVTAFMWAMLKFDDLKGRVFNLGDSRINMSKRQLCDRIKQHVPEFVYNEAVVGADPDKRNYSVSNERIERMGWMPSYSLDDGIQELIKGYRMLRVRRYVNA